jgi:hypothetical protein
MIVKVIPMRCHYKQEWPGLTRVHLEPEEVIRAGTHRLYSDRELLYGSTKFEVDFPNEVANVPIEVGDLFEIMITKVVDASRNS